MSELQGRGLFGLAVLLASSVDGKVNLAFGQTLLNIPLERLAQIDFAPAASAPAAEPASPWLVRALFPGGGSVSFQLEKWSDTNIAGRSAIFGPLTFRPDCVRELQFNLDRPRAESSESAANQFEGFDE